MIQVKEEGRLYYPESGSPQGGVVSPLAANVYLHYVLDEWFDREVQPRLEGKAYLVRYCDDFVIAFTHERDARRVMEVLPKRFGRYGLSLHEEKTRLLWFHRPRLRDSGRGPNGPESFDFLGFTHYWGRSRKGNWVVKQKTESKRLSKALRKVADWCRLHRHDPLAVQQMYLSRQIRGHCAYYGITGNSYALGHFRMQLLRIWKKWLARRNRERMLNWEQFKQLLKRYSLPPARVVHSVAGCA